MINLTLDNNEAGLVLDALAELPLKRSYHVFQRLLAKVQNPLVPPPEPPKEPEMSPMTKLEAAVHAAQAEVFDSAEAADRSAESLEEARAKLAAAKLAAAEAARESYISATYVPPPRGVPLDGC